MIQSRARGLYNAHVIGLCVTLTLSFWAYLLVLQWLYPRAEDLALGRYIYYNIIALIGLLIQVMPGDERDLSLFGSDPFRAAKDALRQTIYVGGVLMFTLLLTKDRNISRFFLFSYLPLLGAFLTIANAALPLWLSRILFTGRHTNHALLIGSPARIPEIQRWLKYMGAFGVEVIGLLSEKKEQENIFADIPIIGTPEDLESIVAKKSIHSIILLDLPKVDEQLHHIVDVAESAGIRLVAVNTLAEKFRHGILYFQQFGLDFITVREEPLEDPVARISKRVLDVAIALPVVFLILPLLAAVVFVMHRLQSAGPLLYRQQRTGAGTEPFEILKFRTMRVENGDASRQASKDDERIFPLGRFLRKSSIDEFPQFWNVLRGEMSLVGPRPHMPEHDARFAEAMKSYHVRSFIKPGLTGLAQIRGFRGEAKTPEDIRRRVECDIEYIEQWSIALDLYIILRTAWQILRPPKTAY